MVWSQLDYFRKSAGEPAPVPHKVVRECTTPDCHNPAVHYLEVGGVNGYYCRVCYRSVELLRRAGL